MRTMRGRFTAALIALAAVAPASAAVTPQAYRDVGVSLPADAAVPPETVVRDESGRTRSLAKLISRP